MLMTKEEMKKAARIPDEFLDVIKRLNDAVKIKKTFLRNCTVCRVEKDEMAFYKGKNPFFVDGRIGICRSCLHELIDFNNRIEVQYVLMLMFVPYIENIWEEMLENEKNPFGAYLSKLNLSQYKNYQPGMLHRVTGQINAFDEDPYGARLRYMKPAQLNQLKAHWGDNWEPRELVQMQEYYEQMKEDFNIENKAHDDYLRKIVKTSLQSDKYLAEGDIQSFQKMSKVYNDLMKAAEFSAASKKKKDDTEGVDSVGLIYALAEKKKFIPQYHNKENPDIVDKTEKNLKSFMHRLISNEADLTTLLENAAKRVMEQEKEEELKDQEYLDIEQLEDDL